jgi:hypothetical protein
LQDGPKGRLEVGEEESHKIDKERATKGKKGTGIEDWNS